jgi:hypothetical protein
LFARRRRVRLPELLLPKLLRLLKGEELLLKLPETPRLPDL